MQVQRGRDELLPPSEISGDVMNFDFPITVDLSFGSPNFLGKYSQGPKDARFIYVNSGTLAGQADSCWTRRAKISLMSVTTEQVNEVLASPGARLKTSFFGRGGDGGPTCAGVKRIVWQVGKK
jgi:hypothetical protein